MVFKLLLAVPVQPEHSQHDLPLHNVHRSIRIVPAVHLPDPGLPLHEQYPFPNAAQQVENPRIAKQDARTLLTGNRLKCSS